MAGVSALSDGAAAAAPAAAAMSSDVVRTMREIAGMEVPFSSGWRADRTLFGCAADALNLVDRLHVERVDHGTDAVELGRQGSTRVGQCRRERRALAQHHAHVQAVVHR